MSTGQDPARAIAERVARRLAGDSGGGVQNDPNPVNGVERSGESPRARVINFISSSPPLATPSSIGAEAKPQTENKEESASFVPQVAQSPWLAPFARAGERDYGLNPQTASHPSQERFGVEEAAVSELVEFFENEKMCSVDPSGKPCDHCAMCSSRGF